MMKCYNCDLVIPPGEPLSNAHPTAHAHANLHRCLELLVFVKDQLLVSLKDAENRVTDAKKAKNDIWDLAEKDQENHQAEIVSLKFQLAAEGKVTDNAMASTKKDQAFLLSQIESLKSQLDDAAALAKKHDEHFLSRIDAFRLRVAEVEQERDELLKGGAPKMFLRCPACNAPGLVSDLKTDKGDDFAYLSCRNCKEEICIPAGMLLSELSRAWKYADERFDKAQQFAEQLIKAEKERDELRNRHDPVMFLRCLACNKAANVSDLKVDESGLSYLSCRNCTKETHVPHEKILAGLAEAWGQANKRNNEAIQLAKQLVKAEGHILKLEKKLHPLMTVDTEKSVLDHAVEYFQNNPDPGLPSNEEGGAVDG